MTSTLDEAIDRRIQEMRVYAQALNTAITIADTVKGLGTAVMNEDYPVLRRELLHLMRLCVSLMATVAGCESSFAPGAFRKEATHNE